MKYLLLLILSTTLTASLHTQPALQWAKCYGGTKNDFSASMIQTFDGGYIMTGSTASTDKDIFLNHGDYDLWIVKLNADGSIKWEKTYGGSQQDGGAAITQTFDAGYIIAGSSNS